MIHDRAIKKVEEHVADALSKGAQVLVGGKRVPGDGSFFSPTVLSDVPPNVRLSNEETFGPVAALIKFETEEEVLKLANDTQYGLAGYFYSRDVGRVWRVAEALEVGMVGSNTGFISNATIPFGGVKESGLGMLFILKFRMYPNFHPPQDERAAMVSLSTCKTSSLPSAVCENMNDFLDLRTITL